MINFRNRSLQSISSSLEMVWTDGRKSRRKREHRSSKKFWLLDDVGGIFFLWCPWNTRLLLLGASEWKKLSLVVEVSPWGNCYLKTEYARALFVDLAWPGHLHSLLGNFPFRIQLTWQMKTQKTHTHTHTHTHTQSMLCLCLLQKLFREPRPVSWVPPADVSPGSKGQIPTCFCLEPTWVLIQCDPLTSSWSEGQCFAPCMLFCF